jgi:hypothetical protein
LKLSKDPPSKTKSSKVKVEKASSAKKRKNPDTGKAKLAQVIKKTKVDHNKYFVDLIGKSIVLYPMPQRCVSEILEIVLSSLVHHEFKDVIPEELDHSSPSRPKVEGTEGKIVLDPIYGRPATLPGIGTSFGLLNSPLKVIKLEEGKEIGDLAKTEVL